MQHGLGPGRLARIVLVGGPTVMPLADPTQIAVHSVVERSQLWRLVPALKAAGARDILVVPIEKVMR